MSTNITINDDYKVKNEHSIGGLIVKVREQWFVWIVISFIVIVTSLPYVYGYLSTPADKKFMGIMLDVPDHTQYFSWMRELSQKNLASNKMTPEANQPIFFNLLWWGMGRLGILLGSDYAVMFQILRILAIILFLLLVYRECKYFLQDELQRRVAFLVISFTAGFGWVLVVIKYLTKSDLLFPLDVFIAEGNTFLGMLAYPHFIAAALYIFVFDLVLQGWTKKQLRYAVVAGFFALFLGWQHTYDLVSVYSVIGAFALLLMIRDRSIPWEMIKAGVIIAVISCPPAIYSVLITSVDPIWKGVYKQFSNAGVFTPNPLHLIIFFGPIFLLAIYSLIRINPLRLKKLDDKFLFIIGWYLISFIVIYLPVDFQVHLLNGWQVPMSILAVFGWFQFVIPELQKRFHPKWPKLRSSDFVRSVMAFVLIVMVIPTNIYLLGWRFFELSKHDYPYYLTKDEINAFTWLDTHGQEDNVVLSSLVIGQYIPAMTGKHAYLAHWAETLDFFTKSKNVEKFFSSDSTDVIRKEILSQGKVNYVFCGPVENTLGKVDFSKMAGFELVYSSNSVSVYHYLPN